MSRALACKVLQQCTAKVRYASQQEAEAAYTSYGGVLHTYYCRGCQGWHRTKLAQQKRR